MIFPILVLSKKPDLLFCSAVNMSNKILQVYIILVHISVLELVIHPRVTDQMQACRDTEAIYPFSLSDGLRIAVLLQSVAAAFIFPYRCLWQTVKSKWVENKSLNSKQWSHQVIPEEQGRRVGKLLLHICLVVRAMSSSIIAFPDPGLRTGPEHLKP